jgi:hypothetical protein
MNGVHTLDNIVQIRIAPVICLVKRVPSNAVSYEYGVLNLKERNLLPKAGIATGRLQGGEEALLQVVAESSAARD